MEILLLLKDSPPALVAIASVVGLCVGSFLNVVIHRLPRMMEAQWEADCAELQGREVPERAPFNLLRPASRCPSCSTPIRAIENVPVVSWLVLRGRCRTCRTPISARYPLVELLTGVLSGLLAIRFGASAALAGALVFAWALVALSFVDLDTQLLPDDITLPLVWLGLIVNIGGTFVDLRSAVLGAIGGYLALWTVYWAFKLLAKKEGMGYGDFKLLAAIGAWLGWQVLPFVILVAAALGVVFGSLALWLSRRGADTRLPFGPYLAVGGLAGLVWGREAVILWVGRFPS